MLAGKIKGFIAYCKVAGFSKKSIESLTLRLKEFRQFLRSKRIKNIQTVSYAHLSDFVAHYKSPSVHVKKARVWSLHQFFHFLRLHGHIKNNIAMDLPYPKIEKTVPYFLTVEEYNRILDHCSDLATALLGLRNLIIIMMLGILGLRTGTIVSMNIQDVDIISGLAWLKVKGHSFRHMVVLPKVICAALQRYFDLIRKNRGPFVPVQTEKTHISQNPAGYLQKYR